MKYYKFTLTFGGEFGNFTCGWESDTRGVFMTIRSLAIASLAIFAAACSSTRIPTAEVATHKDTSRNIPKIDNMIVDLKKSYISQCYEPILAKNPPENQCQTELFQMLERRYHLNYNQQNIDQASNDLFFRDVDSRLRKMVRTDPEVRSAVRSGALRNADEMLSYYKEKYAFDTRSQN